MYRAVFAELILAVLLPARGAPPTLVKDTDAKSDAPDLQGLWLGSWGGGQSDGVIFQPVRAELYLKGDYIEWSGFRDPAKLMGTVHIDAGAKKIHVTPTDEPAGKPTGKAIVFTYRINGDTLALYDRDRVPITLQRHVVDQNPLANAQAALVAAAGINDAGDLLPTEFTELRVGRTGARVFQPERRVLKTKQGFVLVVQETGCKKISVKEARGLLRAPVPVVVTYRRENGPEQQQLHDLWKEIGPPTPTSQAVWQTFARTLRPGTLVFVLSASENAVRP